MGKIKSRGKFGQCPGRPVLREGLRCLWDAAVRARCPSACCTRVCRGFPRLLLLPGLLVGPGRRRGGRDKSGSTFLPFCRSSNLHCMMMHLIFNL